MITAENITDEQIRELLEEYACVANEAYGKMANCHAALGEYDWLDKDGKIALDARARCAAILNERAERAKECK